MSITGIPRRAMSGTAALLRQAKDSAHRAFATPKRPLTEDRLADILREHLNLRNGDTVFIHSSVDELAITFPSSRILTLLSQLVGKEGTILFPTYPRLGSYEFLQKGEV